MVEIQKVIKRYKNKGKREEEKYEEEREPCKIMAQDIVLQQFVYTPDYKDHFVE